jgi:hypothetical protein
LILGVVTGLLVLLFIVLPELFEPRIPILFIMGAVSPPHTTVVNITMERVVLTYISLCSPGIFKD